MSKFYRRIKIGKEIVYVEEINDTEKVYKHIEDEELSLAQLVILHLLGLFVFVCERLGS